MERNGLNTDVGMNMLFAEIERERKNSNAKQLQTSTAVYGQSLPAVEREMDRANANLHFNGTSQAGSLPNPLNGFPLAAYNHSPLLWQFLSSPMHAQNKLRHPFLQAGKALPPFTLSASGETSQLRCEVCGLACETIVDLREHITRKHLATESEPSKERRESISKSHGYGEENVRTHTPQRKNSGMSSSYSQDSEKKSPTDFPIPTPNFTLLSSYSKLPSLNPPIGTSTTRSFLDPAKVYTDSMLPSLLSSQLKNMPLPMLPNAYSILSPFLAFQNMVNSGHMPQATSVQGKLPQGLAMGAATNYPYLRYPTPSGRYVPGNLPFLPTMPVMLPPTPVTSTPNVLESPSVKEKDSFENVFSVKTNTVSEKRKEPKESPLLSSLPNANFSSPHAESLQRRLSVPVISLNKDFRAPHPYSRKPSVSSSMHCSRIQEQNDSTAEQLKHSYTNSQCHNVLGKKQSPLTEKSSRSHPNAKSIEQHISKLISNNEKVLLNPALERVKPRRVFRRNSLDPASLSSYAAAIAGRNTHEAPYLKEDTSRKLFSESDARFALPTSTRTHFQSSTSSDLSFPPGMSSSDYESLVQLSRVSQSHSQLLNTLAKNELQDHAHLTTQHIGQKSNKGSASEAILGKRGLSPPSNGAVGFSAKKPRRATFFECSDCGVRYRKEDNYKIHKRMYCKFKKDLPHSATDEKRNRENVEQAMRQLRRHSVLPEVSTSSMAPIALNKYSFDDALAPVQSVGKIVSLNKVNGNVSSSGNYTQIRALNLLKTQPCASPMKALHNDLCRTKSAEATLQTESASKDWNLSQAKKNPYSTKTNTLIDSGKTLNLLSSVSSTTASSPLTASALFLQSRPSVLPPPSSIPPNKLPPNKRHLMRLFEQGNASSDTGQTSVGETDSSSPTEASKLDKVEGCSKDTSTHPHSFSSNTELVSIMSSPPSVTPSDDIFLSPSHSNVFTFDETSVPRSNYKLLLHEISLRNMHDIGFMKNLSHNKSVWSWQQIQKGLLNQESDESIRRKSPETPQELSQTQRKFFVPSRLSQPCGKARNAFSQLLQTTPLDKPKSDNTITLPQSGPTPNPTSAIVLTPSSLPFKARSETSAGAASICSSSSHSAQGSKEESLVFPMPTMLATIMTSASERLDKAKVPLLTPSLEKKESLDKPVVDNDNTVSSIKDKTDCLSAILFPHLKPTLVAKPHVSFCCMVSPQPACMEIPVSEDSKSTQVSMYRDWAVSEPILIPSDLTISDVLTKWRRSRPGCEDGVTTVVESNCQLILTEHKAYEKFKKSVKDAKNDENDSATKTDEETDSVDETLLNEKVTVPVLLPSDLFESSTQPIYACCHSSHGTDCSASNTGFTTSVKTDANEIYSSVASDAPNYTVSRAQTLNLKSETGDLASLSQANHEDLKLSCEPASRDSAPSPGGKVFVTKSNPAASNHSSCDATESDSDPIDVKIEFFGKIKRRRTRRERTAASPREKRRALECKSPLSPSAIVLPVHQGNVCSNATEDKLRGCALCSIKAGRADLITDADSACQPCRDAALKKNGHHSVAAQKSCTPTTVFFSPPSTSSGFLDKARASSGNTQHWVSSNTPDITEHVAQGSVFRYPSPRSSKSSVSESMGDMTILPQSSSSDPPPLDVDASKVSVVSSKVEQIPSAVSPSLAEVVSEVMRTAAMQSKRQNNQSAKHHHLLSKSRALLPGSLPSSPLLIEQPDSQSNSIQTNSPVARPCLKTALSTPSVPTSFNHPEKESQASVLGSRKASPEEHMDLCEITVTPATPPACSSRPGNGSAVPQSKSQEKDVISNLNEKPNSFPAEGVESSQEKFALQLASSSGLDVDGREDGSCESDEDGVKEDIEGSLAPDGAARPFRCPECKVAFRIGGHLAKHLRSKGHAVAMQKKTLNRLKMRQIQMCVTSSSNNSQSNAENEANSVAAAKDNQNPISNFLAFSPAQGQNKFSNKNNSSEFQLLDGAENLARSQVRALLEGSEEYACVPPPSCDDVARGEIADDMNGSQDPRPFKCIACKVAFRFQGHLDRHFRSNAHLIAVGHYEQDTTSASNQPAHTATNSCHEYLAARDREEHTAIREETSVLSERSNSASPVDLSCCTDVQLDNQNKSNTSFPNGTTSFDRCSSNHPRTVGPTWCPSPEVDSKASRLSAKQADLHRHDLLSVRPDTPRSPVCTELTMTNPADEQMQKNTNLSFQSSASESGLNHLANHKPVSQLHIRSNEQSDSSVPLLSSDRLPHNAVLHCQVSCT